MESALWAELGGGLDDGAWLSPFVQIPAINDTDFILVNYRHPEGLKLLIPPCPGFGMPSNGGNPKSRKLLHLSS